jgi:hypothetical protein
LDTSAVVLNKLLSERNLDIWAKLKLVFLDAAYSSLYGAINKYYEKYSAVPSFDDLEITLREGPASKALATLRLTEVPDVSAEVALDALIDQYTQNETVKLLDKFVDKLPLYDSNEIKDNLANIALTIEEKTHTSEKVFTMADMMMFRHPDELEKNVYILGLIILLMPCLAVLLAKNSFSLGVNGDLENLLLVAIFLLINMSLAILVYILVLK